MFRDKPQTFRMAARLAKWLCSDPERAKQAQADKDIMRRLKSIHAVLSRKAKMAALSQKRSRYGAGGAPKKDEPAALCTIAIASLIHTITSDGI